MADPLVKICGLTLPSDGEAAARAGAHFVGCVLVPSSPRAVDPLRAGQVRAAAGLPLVLVVADRPLEWMADAATRSGASVLQLHGDEGPATVSALRARGPWQVWKGVRVRDGASARDAMERWGGVVDGVLLDGWSPHALGGTGVSFPWEEVAPVRSVLPPGTLLIAAGGLNPENVGRAVSLLRPDVVDVSSGVESSPGVKDHARLQDFVTRARTSMSQDS
jgi:phosphoribosylanthranilate isomerase